MRFFFFWHRGDPPILPFTYTQFNFSCVLKYTKIWQYSIKRSFFWKIYPVTFRYQRQDSISSVLTTTSLLYTLLLLGNEKNKKKKSAIRIYNVRRVQAKLEAQNNGNIPGVSTNLYLYRVYPSGYISYIIIGTGWLHMFIRTPCVQTWRIRTTSVRSPENGIVRRTMGIVRLSLSYRPKVSSRPSSVRPSGTILGVWIFYWYCMYE